MDCLNSSWPVSYLPGLETGPGPGGGGGPPGPGAGGGAGPGGGGGGGPPDGGGGGPTEGGAGGGAGEGADGGKGATEGTPGATPRHLNQWTCESTYMSCQSFNYLLVLKLLDSCSALSLSFPSLRNCWMLVCCHCLHCLHLKRFV